MDAIIPSISPATLSLTQLANMLQLMAVVVRSGPNAFKLEDTAYTHHHGGAHGPPRPLLEWLRDAEVALNFHSG